MTPEYPPAIGGVSDYARQLAEGLAAAGEEVHVWCAGADAGEAAAVIVHPTLGSFGRLDLERTGRLLDQYPGPRRVLVQWVPHGYGRRSMNLPFCIWLRWRAARGDRIELMVHEAYLAFSGGSWRQAAGAAVHRVMTMVLLSGARRVWMSIPAWEGLLKPYVLGRGVPFSWLPIPTALAAPDAREVSDIRARAGGGAIVGHFGTFGSLIAPGLNGVLPLILASNPDACVLLIGAGSTEYAASFRSLHPELSSRVHATGRLDEAALSSHIGACDVLVQPYPDGVSSRRTTTMAGLFLGVPVVTTHGHLTEKFWSDAAIVRLSRVGDWSALAEHVRHLLSSSEERRRLSERGRTFYDRTFDLRHTIAALMAVT